MIILPILTIPHLYICSSKGWNNVLLGLGSESWPFHSQVQKEHYPNLPKEKCISEVLRIGFIIIFHLSQLWETKFSILCDVMFLVRLQGKFDIDHSWKWKISAWRALDYSIGVNREFKQTGTATATWGARKRLFPYFWRLCSPAHSYLGPNFFRFCQRFYVWCTRFTTRATIRTLSWRMMISMAFNFCMVRYSSMMTKYYFNIWIYFVVISINIRGMAKGYTCPFVSRMESFRLCRKLANKLLVLKRNGSLDEKTHRKLRPQHKQPPRIYGLPKLHKPNIPLRPIVSGVNSFAYDLSAYLSDLLSPLTGLTSHTVPNSTSFVQEISSLAIHADETMVSFDVESLFTNVPIEGALNAALQRLSADTSLPARTSLSPSQITDLLGFVLRPTYFSYNGSFYEQQEGAAMGSPVSAVTANLYMEVFEEQALQSCDLQLRPRGPA